MRATTLASALALALLAAGCASPDEGAAAPAPGAPPAPAPGALAPREVEVVVGEGGDPPALYTLEPRALELKVGEPVRLVLRNAGRAGHDLVIEGLDVAIPPVPPGGTSEPVVFTPTAPGEHAMHCTVGEGSPLGHRDNGMEGRVIVR